VLLTGGTTGNAKEAAHKPSLFNYLDPFVAFLARLKILTYHTAYIATPIYHGYGMAVLLLFCAVGKKVVIHSGFDAQQACRLIRERQVEVVTVVPLMLHKMIETNADDLKSLACIASGGAELNPKLVKETLSRLGEVLYNLYGTSEAGLNIIATPQDLSYSAHTIGSKIKGVRLKIVDDHKREVEVGRVGQFCIKNRWSMRNGAAAWIETGDLGYRDEKGYYYLCGRADSMIVSAGENVYPLEVEQVLLTHPQVEDAAVIGIQDEHFGQRLKALVVLVPQAETTKEELLKWLRSRLARFQMPKEIIFVDHLPYTQLGKLDKKLLK
jgi:acyl-CoA synthetase (AMP-forming)/AMP-acid ligase II